MVRDRVIDLFLAVGRSGRLRTDHEDKLFGGLNVGQNLVLPLRRQRNVFPVDPGLALLADEGVVKVAHEVLVFAGIRHEDLSHGVPTSQVRTLVGHILLPFRSFPSLLYLHIGQVEF